MLMRCDSGAWKLIMRAEKDKTRRSVFADAGITAEKDASGQSVILQSGQNREDEYGT